MSTWIERIKYADELKETRNEFGDCRWKRCINNGRPFHDDFWDCGCGYVEHGEAYYARLAKDLQHVECFCKGCAVIFQSQDCEDHTYTIADDEWDGAIQAAIDADMEIEVVHCEDCTIKPI